MENHIPTLINITYISFLVIIIATFFPLQSHSQPQKQPPSVNDYSTCKDIENFYNCGSITNISYPFWGQHRLYPCGAGDLFYLNCHDNKTTTILLSSQIFTVLDINIQKRTMKLKRTDLSSDLCSPQYNDTYLFPPLFQYPPSVKNLTIHYNCTSYNSEHLHENSLCGYDNPSFGYIGDEHKLFEKDRSLTCQKHVKVPVPMGPYFRLDNDYFVHSELERGLNEGFELNYTVNEICLSCLGSEGRDCSRDYIEKYAEFCNYDNCQSEYIDYPSPCSSRHKSMFSISLSHK